MKPKAALVKAGVLPAGSENKRGRMSAAHIAECERLVRDEGYTIDGFGISKPTAATDKPAEPAKVERKAAADPNRIADVPDEARPEAAWEAYRFENGKPVEVGMRTVDNVCGSSLNYCHCEAPRVWVDHLSEAVVRFKPRRTPVKR